MLIEKCDICKKTLTGEHVNLSCGGTADWRLFARRQACRACAKPVFAFMQKQGWMGEKGSKAAKRKFS